MKPVARTVLFAAALLCLPSLSASANESSPAPREMNFTGPLATGGPPLPEGMLFVEPYLVQTRVTGRYNNDGTRSSVDDAPDDWRVVMPVLYGVTDRFTIAATLRGINAPTAGGDRRWALGDTTLSAQYRVYQGTGPARSTLAVGVRQNMPTGRHDQLDRYGLADATGSGAATTMLALYGQAYLLPERNLRVRGNLFYRIPGAGVTVRGRSGYGTAGQYRGRVHLDSAVQVNLGAEYSFNPRWVLAADLLYEREQGAELHGRTSELGAPLRNDVHRASSWRVSAAPAVEYHWSPKIGVIGGVLVSLDGRNSAELLSPQIALAMAF